MKTIAVHQSQYLPWSPYFKKIAQSDIFVFLDNVQFQKNGVQNRNQIRNKEKEFWLTVPINNKLDENINEKKIINTNTLKNHWKSIEQSYSKSKNWNAYKYNLYDLFMHDYIYLVDINQKLINFFIEELEINTNIYLASELSVRGKSNDLIVDICKFFGANKYLSGKGALSYLNENTFCENSIEIKYIESKPPIYEQFHGEFISGLSMLDYFLNCSKEEIINYLMESET